MCSNAEITMNQIPTGSNVVRSATITATGNVVRAHQQERLAGRLGASWRGRSVGRMAGQWQTGAVRLEMAGRSIVPGPTELVFPGPAPFRCSEAARRAGEPSGEGEEPSSEGLGGHAPARPDRPSRQASQVVGNPAYLPASDPPLASKRHRGISVHRPVKHKVADGKDLDLGRGGEGRRQIPGSPPPESGMQP